MDQKTEDWHKFRANSIGASEIGIIMGLSPYKDRETLLQEKAFPFEKGDEKPVNDFVLQKGHRYEIKIRNFVEFDTGLSFPTQPTVIFENPNFGTPLHASLDGITECSSIIIECKYVGLKAWKELKKEKKAPPHYEFQVQQQLLITGAKKCIFAFCVEVKREDGDVDLEYDYFDIFPDEEAHTKIFMHAQDFWNDVLELRKKGKPKGKDYSESQLDNLIADFRARSSSLEALQESLAEIKKEIFEIVGKEKVIRDDCTIQTVVSKGRETIDYKNFVIDRKLIIPNEYIKVGAESVSQRISFKKP